MKSVRAVAVVAIVGLLLANVLFAAPSDTCQINAEVGRPEWNHVWSSTDCDPVQVSEEWVHYEFGDGQAVDLWTNAAGEVDDVEHWYPHPGSTFEIVVSRLSNGEVLGSLTLVLSPITETPTATPPIPAPPRCEVQQETGDVANHVIFSFSCTLISEQWGRTEFGDGEETDVWFSAEGKAETSHAYAYEVGGLTVYNGALSVEYGGETFAFPFEVDIDDRPEAVYLPFVTND